MLVDDILKSGAAAAKKDIEYSRIAAEFVKDLLRSYAV